MKAGDFVGRNFPGTQAGLDAAIAYCSSNGGYLQVGPGLESTIPTSTIPAGVCMVRADSSGFTISKSLFLRSATEGLNGVTDPSIYSDQTLSLATKGANYAQKSMDIVQRFSDSTSAANLSLNVAHFINRYGVLGVGGGDFETGIAVGAYSEHRGNSVITGSMYGAENASTMYSGGSIVNAFGSLNTAQITSGANAKITTARGLQALARGAGSSAGQITTAIAGDFIAGLQNTSSVTITDAIAGQFQGIKDGGVTGSIANAYGIKVGTINMGTVNNYGIRVIGASGGSGNNYGISVEGGKAFFADSLTSNGSGRVAGDWNVGNANTGTTSGTLRVYGGSSGTTSQRILLLRNNTTDMALQANGTAEFLQYNHNLAFGTPAGTTFAVMNNAGQLRIGDGNVATHDIETLHSGLISDSLRVNKGLYLGGQFLTKILRASASLNFDLTAVVSQDLTITVTGAVDGDQVSLGVPNGSITADTAFFAWVSGADTVTVRAYRLAGTPNPASGTFKVTVFQ